MNFIRISIFIFFSLCSLISAAKSVSAMLTNEDATIQVEIDIDVEKRPFYRLFYQNELVLDTSFLGLILDGTDFSKNLTLEEVKSPTTILDDYKMFHGKQKNIQYAARRYEIVFKTETGATLICHFDLSKNGVAFRYQLNNPTNNSVKVLMEHSSFGFLPDTKAWMQPMSKAKSGWKETNPSYEEFYQIEVPVHYESPIGEGYVYPALFKSNDTWVLLSETNVHRNYCGSRLQYDEMTQGLRVTFPQEEEIFPNGELLPEGPTPFTTPWRTIAVGDLKDIVENTLGTDLAAPAVEVDTTLIKGGLASWSWVLLKDDFTNYETSHRFIDYAAQMNWAYCLIDADWDWKIGYDRMQELIDYAKTKEVKILLWYNSSGDWNSTIYTPKSKLVDAENRKKEFDLLKKMGVAGLKIDFFGGDGKSMIAYYHDILQDAAEAGLLINFHGATLPRGWHRTYPNLMTVEAIKGQEFITFDQANADMQPNHCTIIPFTRNVYDPMDFTPMVLDSIPNIIRRTTTTFELALPTLFTSGIQHIAETPEGMSKMPEYIVNYLKDIPTQWDETRFLSGYPGKEVVIARRKDNTWFIAGINGEAKTKKIDLDISFAKNKSGKLFFDGKTERVKIKNIQATTMEIELQPYGGFVIKI